MAIALVSTPDAFALTKGGRMNYVFSGLGRVASPGVGAQIVITVGGIVAPGTSLTLRWNGKDHVLKFVAAPSAPNEFTAGDGSVAYCLQFCEELKAWYPLQEDYTITFENAFGVTGSILIVAKKGGPAFNMPIQLPRLDLGKPFAVGTQVIGVDPILRANYSVLVEVWLQRAGTPGTDPVRHFSRIFAAPIEFGENNKAQFDAGSILHAQLGLDQPTWQFPAPNVAVNSHKKYFVRFAEAWGTPLQPGPIKLDLIRNAYLGGADFVRRAGAGFGLSEFYPSGTGTKLALRLGPTTRYVRYDEPQYLTFLNQGDTDLSQVSLQTILTYTDNSKTTDNAIFESQKLLSGDKITYPVGPAQLELSTRIPQDKTLKEYSVRLVSSGAAWSVVYRFVLNGAYQPYVRYFAYLSSLGCIDTLATYGKGSSELSRFYDQADRYVASGYDVADGQFVNYNESLQDQVEVATGFYPQSVLRSWNDFYRSPSRFRLKNGVALPISIVSKSIKQAKDGDNQFAHKFEYAYNYHNDFYSQELDDSAGDGVPPAGFLPMGGQVVLAQPTIVQARDNTIPDAVRALTPEKIAAMLAAANNPDPRSLGFLTAQAGAQVFRLRAQAIDWNADVEHKPTTRDGYGLTDVPTKAEIETLPSAGLRQPATDATDTPAGLFGFVLDPTTGKAVSKVVQFATALTALFQSLAAPQAAILKTQLRMSLDDVLAVGNESTRSQTIGASHRTQLSLAKLEFIQGVITLGKLKEERYMSVKELALLMQELFDFDALRAKLGTQPVTDPNGVQWVFGSVLACENNWKGFGTDFDNTDFQ